MNDEAVLQTASTEPSSEAVPTIARDELKVSLDLYLGTADIPVSEVSRWLAGGILALPDVTPEAGLEVTIRNGTAVVATGRIVMLDDCYGVRIERTFLRP